jgi:hypothetical protein
MEYPVWVFINPSILGKYTMQGNDPLVLHEFQAFGKNYSKKLYFSSKQCKNPEKKTKYSPRLMNAKKYRRENYLFSKTRFRY